MQDHAKQYHQAGWPVLELPSAAKGPPPEGRTGYEGIDMTEDEVTAALWVGNIGLRMPPDVIGLDVDAYRGGLVTYRELCDRLGVPPPTWISHNGRNDESGIRFYRVPIMRWVAALAGIEIIQRGHRYAVVWPSMHPDGRMYGWWDLAAGGPGEGVPLVEDLPELPWAWQAELQRIDNGTTSSRPVGLAELGIFLDEHRRADAPAYIDVSIIGHFTERVKAGYSRHDTMQHCLTWAMECARAGIASADNTIELLGGYWQDAVSDAPRRAELASERRTTEFHAMLRHAVGRALTHTQAELDKLHDDVAGPTFNLQPPETAPPSVVDVDPLANLPQPIDWAEFRERDVIARKWLVEFFWPWGRGMALWAGAKEGKSELALWCACKLALGENPWSGVAQDPIDVAYFDYEMTPDDLDDRLSDFDIDIRRLEHLHYWQFPALHALDTEVGGLEVERLVSAFGVKAAVFDTFGRAVSGEEDKADTVRAFYRYTGIRLKALGVGYLRTDHSGKDRSKGQRGSSAKRDDVDVVWSQTRTNAGVTLDCANSSRLGWVGPSLKLERIVKRGIISYTTPLRIGWPDGTAPIAAALDKIGWPVEEGPGTGREPAKDALRKAGLPTARNEVMNAALRYRRESGTGSGTGPPDLYRGPPPGQAGDSE